MKLTKICTIFLLFSLFIVGCNLETPTETSDQNSIEGPIAFSKRSVVHHVSVGGADICEALGLPTGCDANFSLVANEHADGSVSGEWQDTFAGGGNGIHVKIDCINVVGNGAVIGGVITKGDFVGLRVLAAVMDNGTSANDPADQISFSFIGDNRDCNSLVPADFQLFNLTNGQVKVK